MRRLREENIARDNEIATLILDGARTEDVAKTYNLSPGAINAIVRKKEGLAANRSNTIRITALEARVRQLEQFVMETIGARGQAVAELKEHRQEIENKRAELIKKLAEQRIGRRQWDSKAYQKGK